MRYIPQSKYSFDDICKQCYDAINRPPSVTIKPITVSYDDAYSVRPMKDYGSLIKV